MKQILQNLKTGETELVEVPNLSIKSGNLLIRTTTSLISVGTERMLMDFGKAGWVEKARQQPDKVKKVIAKIKTDGLLPTIEAVQAKLDQPLPLGYSNVGVIEEVGWDPSIMGIRLSDRVVSNGPHAEVVCVPKNLCARIPDNVSDEEAAFTILGAIGLQGVRLAQPTLGECFVVIGLGLIGLLTQQILQAHGCRVLGLDLDSSKCALARELGAETVDLGEGQDPLLSAERFSRGRGVDGVLITAATKSNEPVHQAAEMCRKRGRIVLSGVTGLELRRDDFFKKELTFQVSCSYGPGRYDPEYEEKGHDYPLGFVRWTEQRNFEAVLDLMATGKLNVKPLITHRFKIEDATQAYDLIASNKEPYVGILLTYGVQTANGSLASLESPDIQASVIPGREHFVRLKSPDQRVATTHPSVGFIGAGNFSGQVILPALQKTAARLKTIASSGGVSAPHLGTKFGFETSTIDADEIFADPEIDTVFITTRHHTHAQFLMKALRAKKNVFVEKPLCLTNSELEQIIAISQEIGMDQPSYGVENPGSPLILTVGFNRRFAPQVQKIKSLLTTIKAPKSMIMTVNAGMIPPDHWTQDPEIGGGRIIGEACHFIDLLRFLVGHPIVSVNTCFLQKEGPQDTLSFSLKFADGSIGTVHYFANGHKSFPKERLEVFSSGRVLQLDNFRKLWGFGWPGFKKMHLWRQDKGHSAEIAAFIKAVHQGGDPPISFSEIVDVTRTSFQIAGLV